MTEYVVFLRAKPYTVTQKVDGIPVKRYWLLGMDANREIFTVREKLTPQEKARGKKTGLQIISARVQHVEILN